MNSNERFSARLDMLDRARERHARHRDCWPVAGCLICAESAPTNYHSGPSTVAGGNTEMPAEQKGSS